MSEEYEVERSVAREEAVATMQAVVDGVASGTLRFASVDGDPIDVTVPDAVELEIELEFEDDETSVEVELEWPEDRETAADESAETEAESEPRAATATEADDVEEEDGESERVAVQAGDEGGADEGGTDEGGAGEGGTDEDGTDEGGMPEGRTDEALGGTLEEVPLGPAEAVASLARFEVFRDRADEYRWRLVHHNGNVIATSGEGYTSKQNALKGMRSVMSNAPEATVEDASSR